MFFERNELVLGAEPPLDAFAAPCASQEERPMSVRAKFRVQSKTEFEGGSNKIVLTPVYGTSEEGREYYIDFTPADPS